MTLTRANEILDAYRFQYDTHGELYQGSNVNLALHIQNVAYDWDEVEFGSGVYRDENDSLEIASQTLLKSLA